jgi:hypothetical protein
VDEPVTGSLVAVTVGEAAVGVTLADGLMDFEGVGDMVGDLDTDFDGLGECVTDRLGVGLFVWSPSSCPYPG